MLPLLCAPCLSFPDVGQFERSGFDTDVKHGEGSMKFKNGDVYTGQW